MKKKRGKFVIQINFSNRWIYFLVTLGILLIIGVGVYAAVVSIAPGHNSEQIFIPVGGGKYITLQNAIDFGYFFGLDASLVPKTSLPSSTPYHLANQILITVNCESEMTGKCTMTLQEAITNDIVANGATQSFTTTLPAGGEYANKINVNAMNGVTMTLENAINQNLVGFSYSWKVISWTSNNACPTTTFTGSVTCKRNDGTDMGTTCGTYAGCSCPKPAPTTETACTWKKRTSNCADCASSVGTSVCGSIPTCSIGVGSSCSSSGSISGIGCFTGGSCSCGSLCTGRETATFTCSINQPPEGA